MLISFVKIELFLTSLNTLIFASSAKCVPNNFRFRLDFLNFFSEKRKTEPAKRELGLMSGAERLDFFILPFNIEAIG